MKEKLLISACFLETGYKYDGTDNKLACIDKLQEKYELVLICPEVFGQLGTPRRPSEIKDGKVFNDLGQDVTANFISGSKLSLEKAIDAGCKKALLKAKSPSCGYKIIYDGSFKHIKKEGNGIFTTMLLEKGFEIYTEDEIEVLLNDHQ